MMSLFLIDNVFFCCLFVDLEKNEFCCHHCDDIDRFDTSQCYNGITRIEGDSSLILQVQLS